MDWKHILRGGGIDVYFSICPLCLSQNSIKSELGIGALFSKDYITCSKCGAKWEVGIGKTGFDYGKLKWAKLVVDGINGKNPHLLNKKKEPEFWQHAALKGYQLLRSKEKEPSKETIITKEREIIKEVVKIRCRYCGKLFNETEDRCPYCSGR